MNQMGGGGNTNGVNIEYYKFKQGNPNQTEEGGEVIQMTIMLCVGGHNIIHGESNLTYYAINCSAFVALGDKYRILAISVIPSIKSVCNGIVINGGTLQERADQICELEGLPKIDINDYLEPISEEEFYNIKPE